MSTAEIKVGRDVRLVLGPELAGTLMTTEEFDSVDDADDGFVYELIHGVLVVSPPPDIAERDPNGELEYLLRRYRDDHPLGSALDATVSEHTVITPQNRRRADRVIWAGLGRLPDFRHDVPAIVVELVSGGKRDRRRDYVEKRDEYLAAGVREYWVIDRFRRTLTAHRAGADPVVVTGDATYQSPILPGFELPLGRLFAIADRWKSQEQRPR